jgi:phage gp36-like protein
MGYLTLASFRLRTLMPKLDVDAVEADVSGFTQSRLDTNSAKIDTRLRKRYAVPFSALVPYPEAVLEWLTKITTYELYLKRGVDPSDQTLALVRTDKEQAEAELKEASDSVTGLFDLPVRDSADGSAVVKGGPIFYTETSPYTGFDIQRQTGSDEDRNGRR